MKKHAFALLPITHAGASFASGQTILDMDAGQFDDWQKAELVREATAKEVAAAKGGNSSTAKPRKTRAKSVLPPEPAPDGTITVDLTAGA